jgi:uncharacterized protein involved in response to NO
MKALKNMTILAIGFRPFFWLGSLFGAGLIAYWLLTLAGHAHFSQQLPASFWHAHEMLFGYVIAIISGFLLTAVQNWTGMTTAKGHALLLLVVVWLAGRLGVFFVDVLPESLWTSIDLAYLPLLMFFIARPLIISKNYRNLILLAILAGFTACNLVFHLSDDLMVIQQALLSTVYLVVLIMVIIGGRVIPMFTRGGVPDVQTTLHPWVEIAAPVSIVLVLLSQTFVPGNLISATIALLAGAINLYRLWGWGGIRTTGTPIVWVLHLGYLWIGLGLITLGLDGFTELSLRSSYIHMFTVGAMGTLVLGMITRVALGHTGRPFQLPAGIPLAYALVSLGALIRALLPLLWPDAYKIALYISGSLWIIAFAIFLLRYTPVLWQPRIDGRPG